MKFKAVLFDLVGTTVTENDSNTIIGCFEEAFQKNNIDTDIVFLKAHRGRGKKEIIESLLATCGISEDTGLRIYDDFKRNVESNIKNFGEAEGAGEIFSYLKTHGIKLGIGTGLPGSIFELILSHLGWESELFDYIGIAEDIGTVRPNPEMIIQIMRKLNIKDVGGFLKIGDTAADIHEGKNVGVKTAVILSGTQDSGILKNEKPDFILESLTDIKEIIS